MVDGAGNLSPFDRYALLWDSRRTGGKEWKGRKQQKNPRDPVNPVEKPTFSLGGYDAEQTIWNHLAWPAILLFIWQHKQ